MINFTTKLSKIDQELFYAAEYGDLRLIQKLISQGANIHAVDNYDETPLHVASLYGHFQCVKFFVEQGVGIHSKDKEGDIALHYAAMEGKQKCVEYLLNLDGAVLYLKDDIQRAIDLAIDHKHVDTAEFIRTFMDHNALSKTIEKEQNLIAEQFSF